ncbi:MAG: hypothetical protein OJF51_004411 [Nitrospira sp.]|nr:MAG: hypothetical protein OJF51_004411 [Nitrospira sp.]
MRAKDGSTPLGKWLLVRLQGHEGLELLKPRDGVTQTSLFQGRFE